MTDEAPPTLEDAQAAAEAEAEAQRTQAAYELARLDAVVAVLTGPKTAAFLSAVGAEAEQLLPGIARTELELIVSDISQRAAMIQTRRSSLQFRLNPTPAVPAGGAELPIAP